jgi:Protein of unknown function (DUF2934)
MTTTTSNPANSTVPNSANALDGSGAVKSATDGNRIESGILARSSSRSARHALIAEAAYNKAQQRGFTPGDDWHDWFAAEREVDALLDPDL